MFRSIACTLLVLAAPAVALAADPAVTESAAPVADGVLTYSVFETSVDHADLANCPEGLDLDVVFCRLTLADERAHVWAFSLDGDQPLVGVRHFELNEALLPF